MFQPLVLHDFTVYATEQVIEEVTVHYYKPETFIPDFEATYPDKFNKMDYMGKSAIFHDIARFARAATVSTSRKFGNMC